MLFDDILVEIGEFGPYQICLFLVLGLVGVPTGWQNMGITFFGAHMDHWCEIPALSEVGYDQQKYIAIPDDEDGDQQYSQCYMYNLDYSNYTIDDYINWNRSEMVDEDTATVKCQSWLYDQSEFVSSVVSQMDLVCDNGYLVSLIQTLYMSGFLVGCVIFGQLSDRIGRKKTLLSALVLEVVFALSAAFMPYYIGYTILRFFVGGSAAGGGFTTMFVICMELIGPSYRVVMGCIVQLWFAVGVMTIPLLSYAVRDHIKLQIVCALSVMILWLLALILSESPRWLVAEGKDEEATEILQKIASINGTTLPKDLHLEDNRGKPGESDMERKPYMLDLLRTPNLRKITLNMWLSWFVTSLVYYGLSLGVTMLGGSIFFNSFLSGAVEIPSYLLCCVVLVYLGRRWPTVATLLLSGIFCFVCIAFLEDPDKDAALTSSLLIGKFFISGTFCIIYVYAAELFPTVIRQVGVGSSSMFARVGGLIQPQITLLDSVWAPAPWIIYGVFSCLAGVFAIFLPETKGRKLPETIEDGENFSRNMPYTEKDQGLSNEGFSPEDPYGTRISTKL